MEVLVAALMLLLVGVAGTRSMAVINQRASAARLRLNARAVVERCIVRALNAPFNATTEPQILEITTGEVRYNDILNDDVSTDVDLVVQDTGGSALVTGKLFRSVSAVTNVEGVDIRKVSIRVEYVVRGKTQNYSASTVRAKG